MSDGNLAHIQQAFVSSPGKSTRRVSRELQPPQTTVWRILRKSTLPIHWHLSVRDYLNVNYPRRRIGRQATRDRALHHWPPRSPDFTTCDFFL
ncbi:hypothetical protein J6590_091269 [Homalodisca vitripennis]|nr:hypothetical protein J6590_091269 [Homalodisca vitripennis]